MFTSTALLLKGCSVVLYSNRKLRQGQYTVVTDWPGGLYCTTGMLVAPEVALPVQVLGAHWFTTVPESTATAPKTYTKRS